MHISNKLELRHLVTPQHTPTEHTTKTISWPQHATTSGHLCQLSTRPDVSMPRIRVGRIYTSPASGQVSLLSTTLTSVSSRKCWVSTVRAEGADRPRQPSPIFHRKKGLKVHNEDLYFSLWTADGLSKSTVFWRGPS